MGGELIDGFQCLCLEDVDPVSTVNMNVNVVSIPYVTDLNSRHCYLFSNVKGQIHLSKCASNNKD